MNLLLIVSFLICCDISLQLSCKDDENQDVDWFILYKLPKIARERRGSDLQTGKAYAFLTSRKSSSWILSNNSIESNTSMLGNTWQRLKEKEMDSAVSYLFYNDEPPPKYTGKANGHLKGVIAFDNESGFWLMHTIPRFSTIEEYAYPITALTNGQSAICVTFGTDAFTEICTHLLYCHPNIYEKKMGLSANTILDQSAKSIFSSRPAFIRRAPFTRVSTLLSLNNELFHSFAKDNQLVTDLYSSIIAPHLDSSLMVESWRRGVGTFLDPFCMSDYSVVDIESVNMTVANKKGGIFFRSTEDHSKWAISIDASSSWVCLADLNRMLSQAKRGGGALCFQSKPVWKAFRSIIHDVSQCAIKG